MKLKFSKPIFAQCPVCFKQYNMVEWGVRCPSCKDTKNKNSKK
ncbi:MAG: hypothetical protein PHF67_04720 [Candidatus Nanoarchaeia archaeon]|nr:hypothetical protein [Candidatus Nanoarchaeia archaeon]